MDSDNQAQLEQLFFQLQQTKAELQRQVHTSHLQQNSDHAEAKPFQLLKRVVKSQWLALLEQAAASFEVPEQVPDNLRQSYKIIAYSGFFEANYYLTHNPDVAAAKLDPLLHYLQYGYKEQRNVSPHFNTSNYLQAHPEVQEQQLNPLLHYLCFGLVKDGTED